MQQSNQPTKIQTPFANSGQKNTIPVPSQTSTTPGAASFTDGFPSLTMTAISAGGVPPSGKDFNGILNMITAIQQWQSGGGMFTFDSAWSSANGGYPKGAVLQSSDGANLWLNLADGNTTNPDATDGTAANWASLAAYGIGAVTGLTNANVTLTPAQYGKNIITLAGALTGNVQIIFPLSTREWTLVNNTTGAYTVTCKTASGTGVAIPQGSNCVIYGDGTNLNLVSTPGRLLNVQIFKTSGTYTPTPGTNSVIVEVQGGGGAGGGCAATGAGQCGAAPGGGAGGYARKRLTSGFAGQTVTVGAGGAGVAGGIGNSGGTSSFGSILSATGGSGGGVSAASSNTATQPMGANQNGGSGSGGDLNLTGGQGQYGMVAPSQVSGKGGASMFGDGAPLVGGTSIGNSAVNFGAGGSGGALSASAAAASGGSGAPGIVIVWEYA